MSLRPGAAIDDLGGDVINPATSTPVNGSDRNAARVARTCKRRGLHLRAQVRSQEER